MDLVKKHSEMIARNIFVSSFAIFIFTALFSSAVFSASPSGQDLSAAVGNTHLALLTQEADSACPGAGPALCGPDGRLGGGGGTIPGASGTLTAAPTEVDPGQNVTLSWSTDRVKSCVLTEDGKEISKYTDAAGVRRGPISTDTVYALNCVGDTANVTLSRTLTVKVNAAANIPSVVVSATPAEVNYRGSATVSWTSEHADVCILSKNGMEVSRRSPYTAAGLTANALFKVTCSNNKGKVASIAAVTIIPPKAPEVTLSASPESVSFNGSTKVSWSSTDATRCIVKQGARVISTGTALTGEVNVPTLLTTTDITATCTGERNSTTEKKVTITVAAPAKPTASLMATPAAVSYEGTSTLSWTSTDAVACRLTGPAVSRIGITGSLTTGKLIATREYTLTCTGPGGSAESKATVTVTPPQKPTAKITASVAEVAAGNPVNISWTSANARTCKVQANTSTLRTALNGVDVQSAALRESTVFWVSCAGVGGTTVDAVMVQVTPPEASDDTGSGNPRIPTTKNLPGVKVTQ